MKKSLKDYRQEKYLTMEEFAEYLGFAEDTLYRIQRGEKPRLKTMRLIASKLGVSPGDIADFVRTRVGES